MHFTIINIVGALSPLILTATLRGIWKEGRSRSLTLRMLPPERRPVRLAPRSSWAVRASGAPADRKRRSRPLWTLQDCQMELLTEGVIHAFEASATTYKPDRVAANHPPGRVPPRVSLHRAKADCNDRSSILLRTLQRRAGTLAAVDAAKHRDKPEIADASEDTLAYTCPPQSAHSQGIA